MVFRDFRQGDSFKFVNFPEIDMIILVQGRMRVTWYDASEPNE